jgi:hypothetical protein
MLRLQLSNDDLQLLHLILAGQHLTSQTSIILLELL